jgi:SAM-dependent methyltransferase
VKPKDEPGLKVLPSPPEDLDFTWYRMVRDEMLAVTVGCPARMLDVGCGPGDALLMLASRVRCGVGVDVSRADLARARARAEAAGLHNLRFARADAADLPFADATFDAVLCTGDVLGYSGLFGKQDRAVREMHRVLANGGLAVYEGMNWDWEYALSPRWTFFLRSDDGTFQFHRVRRTASGLEVNRSYDVVPGTPLHDWVARQPWPESPSGDRTSLDVGPTGEVPRRWLKFRGVTRNRFYKAPSLRRLYRRAGFATVHVTAYGQTYDVASRAGLLAELEDFRGRLARAEAQVVLGRSPGGGPWLFLTAWK